MDKYAIDLDAILGKLDYYKSESKRPTPINSHGRGRLDLTYTDSLLAIF